MNLRVYSIALLAFFCGTMASLADLDTVIERWFSRHPETIWQPLVVRWGEVRSAMQSPVENLTLPLDYYPNGRIKARLRAKKAQIFLDGMIFAENVEVEMLALDGMPEGILRADDCLFDRQAKHGYCQGAVSVAKDSDRITGVGMYFSVEEQFIKILAKCEIRTRRIKGNFGRIR